MVAEQEQNLATNQDGEDKEAKDEKVQDEMNGKGKEIIAEDMKSSEH